MLSSQTDGDCLPATKSTTTCDRCLYGVSEELHIHAMTQDIAYYILCWSAMRRHRRRLRGRPGIKAGRRHPLPLRCRVRVRAMVPRCLTPRHTTMPSSLLSFRRHSTRARCCFRPVLFLVPHAQVSFAAGQCMIAREAWEGEVLRSPSYFLVTCVTESAMAAILSRLHADAHPRLFLSRLFAEMPSFTPVRDTFTYALYDYSAACAREAILRARRLPFRPLHFLSISFIFCPLYS